MVTVHRKLNKINPVLGAVVGGFAPANLCCRFDLAALRITSYVCSCQSYTCAKVSQVENFRAGISILR